MAPIFREDVSKKNVREKISERLSTNIFREKNGYYTEGSRTSLPQDGSRGKIEEKNMVFLFFVSLACSRDFISAIFGFLRKFSIDIGVQI